MTELPTTFGKYFLTEKLATGGMAEIYLAKLIGPGGFEKQLVIKQIHPRLSGQRHFVDLFVAEAKTLVTLTHGNIVPVYELGVIDDTYFIAMEYIDGPTLHRLTEILYRRDVAMAPAVGAWIAAKILEGLDYAHRKGEGVIHRDLSPRNVMLSRDGEVKIVDFGIAVTLGDAGEAGGSAPTGSFPYMSPEQVRREPLTGQSDLFSVGVLLWEMLVGHRLFARDEADATLAAVLDAPIPRPSEVRAEVPARLDELVMKALARDRGERWDSAAAMLAALQRFLYGLDQTPGPRDVAALVARYCPPQTRRIPTEADALVDSEPRAAAAHADPASGIPPTTPSRPPAEPAAVPRTAVIPRAGEARGRRAPRQQTFATHVELLELQERIDRAPSVAEEAGEGTTPSAPTTVVSSTGRSRRAPSAATAALVEADDGPTDGDAAETAAAPARPSSGRLTTRPRAARVDDTDAGHAVPPPVVAPPALRAGRGGRLLVGLGLGGLALAIAVVVAAVTHRAPDDASRDAAIAAQADAAATAPRDGGGSGDVDAAIEPLDARTDATVLGRDAGHARDGAVGPLGRDASPTDAARASRDAASITVDAGEPREPRDAATPRVAVDAARPPGDDGGSREGTGTLRVGAAPWGEIVLDGKPAGRTPRTLTVTAGHHDVEIVFPADDPPRRSTFSIDVHAGETIPLQADFTR